MILVFFHTVKREFLEKAPKIAVNLRYCLSFRMNDDLSEVDCKGPELNSLPLDFKQLATQSVNSHPEHEAVKSSAPSTSEERTRTSNRDNQLGSFDSAPTRGEVFGDDDLFPRLQAVALPMLERLGSSWDTDVEDIYPPVGNTIFYFMKEAPFSIQHHYMTDVSCRSELRRKLGMSLESWPTLRSIVIEYDSATRVFVVLRNNQRLLDSIIIDHPDVESAADLANLQIDPMHALGHLPSTVMLRVVVAHVTSTGTLGFVVLQNHAAYDFISLVTWQRDLEQIMCGHSPVKLVPYKMFAEAYYLHNQSVTAQRTISFHLNRYKGINVLRGALWPPQAVIVQGTDSSNQRSDKSQFELAVTVTRRCSFLAEIKSTHGITASLIVRTAIAIFNTCMTGHTHAIFTMPMAGRTWPFLQDSVTQFLPNPVNIAGPTLAATTSILHIRPEETLGSLLERVRADQRMLRKHQHTPLSLPYQIGKEDFPVWLEAKCQYYNWLPERWVAGGIDVNDRALKLVHTRGYEGGSSQFFMWECGLQEAEETVWVRAKRSPDLFTNKETRDFAETVLDIVEWICEVENWTNTVDELQRHSFCCHSLHADAS